MLFLALRMSQFRKWNISSKESDFGTLINLTESIFQREKLKSIILNLEKEKNFFVFIEKLKKLRRTVLSALEITKKDLISGLFNNL